MITDEKKMQIIENHASQIHDEIRAEEAKGADEMEREALRPEVEALSQSLDDMYKNPTRWVSEIEQAEKSLEIKIARLQELGGMEADIKTQGLTNRSHLLDPQTGQSISPYPETSEQLVEDEN